jgi:hypothetical protein
MSNIQNLKRTSPTFIFNDASVKDSALFLTHFFNGKDEYAQSGHENSKNEIVKIKLKKNVKLCDE